jgi:cyclophilin family peptidyl-prolyl cis-trans isomerase
LRTVAWRGNITPMSKFLVFFRRSVACLLLVVSSHGAFAQRAEPRSPPRWFATVETTRGKFVLEIDRDWAPLGADHLWQLIRAGFYDDSRFTRVVPNFIVQFGVAGDSAKNARWSTAPIPDDSVKHSNVEGTFAFAMRGPNDRTTQVFISVVDNARLDPQGFAPLGRVVEGMDVVKSIYSGYGESSGGGVRAGKQAPLMNGGNAYVDREFPKLDKLIRITISEPR